MPGKTKGVWANQTPQDKSGVRQRRLEPCSGLLLVSLFPLFPLVPLSPGPLLLVFLELPGALLGALPGLPCVLLFDLAAGKVTGQPPAGAGTMSPCAWC